jgi:hypothetical protein
VSDVVVFTSEERIVKLGRAVEPHYAKRFADQITSSFYEACRIGNLDAARQLMEALDWEIARSMVLFRADARRNGDGIAAVYARYQLEISRREQT